jgi:nicotinamide mononucleotide (NMN) deamidase PncC
MEPAIRLAVEAVHASPVRAVVHVTGGAAQSLGWIMSVPGASRTLLEARVPYAREAMVDLLGDPLRRLDPEP